MPDLKFQSDAAYAEGLRKARAVWDRTPTDLPVGDGTFLPLCPSDDMVRDAGMAFAVLEQSARIDGLKMPAFAGGAGEIVSDPVPNLPQAVGPALQAVSDYARWVMSTKPARAAKKLGI